MKKRVIIIVLFLFAFMQGCRSFSVKKEEVNYTQLADFIFGGGEHTVKESLYTRWLERQKGELIHNIKTFIQNNYVIRDGKMWYETKDPILSKISLENALKRMLSADVIFYGEQHNQAGEHLLEVFLLELLYSNNKRITVFMEMFEKQTQDILDEYLSGKITEEVFIEKLKDPSIRGLWPNYYKDYRPIVETCKKKKIPLKAGFPPRDFAALISRDGEKRFYDSLTPEKKKLVATKIIIPQSPYAQICKEDIRMMNEVLITNLMKRMKESKNQSEKDMLNKMITRFRSQETIEKMCLAQFFKDTTMAESIAEYLRENPDRKIYAIAGSKHVNFGWGIVEILKRLNPQLKVIVLSSITPKIHILKNEDKRSPADILFFVDSIETYVQELPHPTEVAQQQMKLKLQKVRKLLKFYKDNTKLQEKAMRKIEKVRGLKFKYPVTCNILTPEELRKKMKEWWDKPEVKQYLTLREKILKAFKLIEGDFNLEKVEQGNAEQSFLGFYLPETKYLYIVPSRAGEKKLWALRIHESIHALQDQWFNLELISKTVKNDDEELAFSALVEGEAVYLMMEVIGKGYWRKKMLYGVKGSPHTLHHTKTNYFLEQKIFTYRKGAQFVKYLVDRGGWGMIDKAFKKRPISTAEILHPEKYIDGYQPPKVATPKKNTKHWTTLAEGVLGEANLAILLKINNIESNKAEKLASLWHGDTYLFSQNKRFKNLYNLTYHLNVADKNSVKELISTLKSIFPDSKLFQKGSLIILNRKIRFKG